MKKNGGESLPPSFAGKIVVFYLKRPTDTFVGGIPIFDPKAEEIFGRTFVFGKSPQTPDDWTAGLELGIAIDQVGHFLVFENMEEFVQRMSFIWEQEKSKSIQ